MIWRKPASKHVREVSALLLVLAWSGCVCKSQHHEMLKASRGCQHCPYQPDLPCPNSPSCGCFTAGVAQSPKTSPAPKPCCQKAFPTVSPVSLLASEPTCDRLFPLYGILPNACCQNQSHFVSFKGHPVYGASCIRQPGSFVWYISSQGLF